MTSAPRVVIVRHNMAHKDEHRKVTGWLPEEEADALEQLARQNERSIAAELRLAVRAHLGNRDGDTPVRRTAEATA